MIIEMYISTRESLFASVTLISSIGRLEFCNHVAKNLQLATITAVTLLSAVSHLVCHFPLSRTSMLILKIDISYRGRLFFHLYGCFSLFHSQIFAENLQLGTDSTTVTIVLSVLPPTNVHVNVKNANFYRGKLIL